MKIKSITIKNYKSILDETVDGFTHVNMVFGHNNSGKSNFLRFINDIFCRKIAGNDIPRVDESRLDVVPRLQPEATSNFWTGILRDVPYIFRNNDRTAAILFEISFTEKVEIIKQLKHFSQIKDQYFAAEPEFTIFLKGEITPSGLYDAQIKLNEAFLNEKNIFRKDSGKYFESATPGTNLFENGYEAFIELLSVFDDSILFIDNDRYFNRELESAENGELTPKTFTNWVHNLTLDSERYKILKKIIKEIVAYKPNGDQAFQIAEKCSPINNNFHFEFSRFGEFLELMVSNSHDLRIPIENYGTGIQQILYLLTKIAEKQPRIVLIEELELNLSPKYQMELLSHFLVGYIEKPEERLKQLFFTTHAPNLCYRTDFQIHKVTMNNKGETKIERFGENKKAIRDFYPAQMLTFLIEQNV